MRNLLAYLAGVLFALGLSLSGMTDPHRVIGFLQIGPDWSESLMFVMAGALSVTLITFPLILKRRRPLLEETFHLGNASGVDRRLFLGAILFGIGWGISGYCPGPLVVGLTTLGISPWLCFSFFVLGQWVARRAVGR